MKTLLSDFGGFNDGLLFLPSVLMAFYAKRMFYTDTYTTMPVKRKKRLEKTNSIQDKFAFAGQGDSHKLEEEDIRTLAEEANLMVLEKIRLLSSLFHMKRLCRNDRKQRLKIKAIERFESMFDMNSLVLTCFDTTTEPTVR